MLAWLFLNAFASTKENNEEGEGEGEEEEEEAVVLER
jgi:hypothetical protein